MIELHGLSYEKAMLYGMPHIGARYTHNGQKWKRNGARRYERTQEWCAICGRPSNNCHHVVPISNGAVFELCTPRGNFPLRSPLFAVCGSGTTGCHSGFHGGAWLKARWLWDSPAYGEAWCNGELLARFAPHHPALYCYGQWEIENRKTGLVIAHRERY